jgi:outer membrane murein-binding lipoprotein Lpp/YHS domain-containing protein
MPRLFLFASLSVFAAIGLMLAGCSNQQASEQASASPQASADQPEAMSHAGHEHAATGEAAHAHNEAAHADNEAAPAEPSKEAGQSQYEDVLAELSPADRALVDKQKTCPVSGAVLGSMGKPYKVTVNGKDVFLCCPGCEAEIKANPAKYLAKLAQ